MESDGPQTPRQRSGEALGQSKWANNGSVKLLVARDRAGFVKNPFAFLLTSTAPLFKGQMTKSLGVCWSWGAKHQHQRSRERRGFAYNVVSY